MNKKVFEENFFGRKLSVEFSNWAEQTNGSVLIRYQDTVVLVTTVMSPKEIVDLDYFPLSVDYEEKFYAAGKIIGSRFIRREGRPSDEAVLTGRLVDRAIRPLFPDSLRREVQIVITVLSLGETDADWPALLGASLALLTSNIPWQGPIAGLRLARKDGQLIFNPTFAERQEIEFDAFYAGDETGINMIEFSGDGQVTEQTVLDSLQTALNEFAKIIAFQKKIAAELAVVKDMVTDRQTDPVILEIVKTFLADKLAAAIYGDKKTVLKSNLTILEDELIRHLTAKNLEPLAVKTGRAAFETEVGKMVRQNILTKEKRPDGRGLKEIRSITCQTDVLPRAHGSAIFMRGLTHALSSVTLGGPGAEQTIETIELSGTKRFIHHYNFPPYSTGETGSLRRGPGRRELGHGYLAEKALLAIIPTKQEFPYTIRVVSEILSSNGSSSMASVCGSSLALMTAGVPVKSAVAGIAIGLFMDDNRKNYKLLSDIQGPEDHHGDMDLKVAGTRNGITAIQMDVKIRSVGVTLLKEALAQAREARWQILDEMTKVINAPRDQLSPYAPRVALLKIDPQKIGLLIGSGGKTIQNLIAKSGVTSIDVNQDGTVAVVAPDDESLERGRRAVEELTKEYKAGEVVEGTVSKILDFGAVVNLDTYNDGLLHISELAHYRVNRVEDIVRLGDKVKVKILNIEPTGKISLSRKALLSVEAPTAPATNSVGPAYRQAGRPNHASRFRPRRSA